MTASLESESGLDWIYPGKAEVTVVGHYVATEAPAVHAGFGGSSQLDVEQIKFVNAAKPYQLLEQTLKEYIAKTFKMSVVDIDPDLCDRISRLDVAYRESKKGLWHRFWYGCGNVKDVADAWLGLVPDQYGLSVIKAGIAVVFMLAEKSKEKRDKVFNAFTTLQEALLELHPHRARFQSDPAVKKSIASLYEAVVRTTEKMTIILLNMEKSSPVTRISQYLKREEKTEEVHPRLHSTLEALEISVSKYRDAIDLARDQTHMRTEAYSHYAALGITSMSDDLRKQNAHVYRALCSGTRAMQEVVQRQREQDEDQRQNRTLILRFLMDSQKKNTILQSKLFALEQQRLHNRRRTAVVSLSRLCSILTQPLSMQNQNSVLDQDAAMQHPSKDLSSALAEQTRVPLRTQGQVNFLLEHQQFNDWMSSSHPALILVDANVRQSATASLSAISVLSGTLATSLMEVYPGTAVVVHFFCGLHSSNHDAWNGPTGLVRSLILQLLMHLNDRDPEMRSWNLDFIDDREFLQDLEHHSLDQLSSVLHSLLYQFTPDTYVYCIIDSISSFDRRNFLNDLEIVMEGLRKIVDDRNIVSIVKILLTNPFRSTRAILEMPLFREDPGRLISLSQRDLVPGNISRHAMDDRLLRTPSPGYYRERTPSPVYHPRTPTRAEEYGQMRTHRNVNTTWLHY